MVEQGPWAEIDCLSLRGGKCRLVLLFGSLGLLLSAGADAAAAITMWVVVVGTAVSSLKSSSSTRVAPEGEGEEMFALVLLPRFGGLSRELFGLLLLP